MPDSTRVALFDGPGQPLRIETVPIPALAREEILVEVLFTTLCGSDLHTYTGRRKVACPVVLGHEVVARVVEVAEPCEFHVGERVTWSICSHCGGCFFCRHGLPQKCESLFKYGHESNSKARLSGGLAEHCILRPGTHLCRVPDEIDNQLAATGNCAAATAHAVMRTAGDTEGETIVIFGAGLLGLMAIAVARQSHAADIIVVDRDADRLVTAKQFGATCVVAARDQSSTDELQQCVQQLSGGRGADLALEMSGASSCLEQAVDLLRVGGRIILAGTVLPVPPVAIDPQEVVRRMLRIEGVHNYRPEDLAAAVDFLHQHCGDSPFQRIVGQTFPLEEVDQAFACALQDKPLRAGICFESPASELS